MHSHAAVVYLSMYRTCIYVNKCLCTVNSEVHCVPLPPQPPSSAPRPLSWSCLTTLSFMCLPAGTTLVLSFKDHLLEDIKATERGEVEADSSDMLKCCLRGVWLPDGGVELVHRVGGTVEVSQTGVSLEHCHALTGVEDWLILLLSLHQVSLTLTDEPTPYLDDPPLP